MKTFKAIMNIEELKIYGINAVALFSSFTALNEFLKVILLLASIVYTVVKIITILKNNFNKKE
jgi:hypothetical protein